jgi:hypothetical protein
MIVEVAERADLLKMVVTISEASRVNDWPFDQPPDCAVISIRQIADGREPILHVTHDSDDHGWQFLGWGDARTEDGVVLLLSKVLDLDPSVQELADLPPGWHAWRRTVREPWTRELNPGDDDS